MLSPLGVTTAHTVVTIAARSVIPRHRRCVVLHVCHVSHNGVPWGWLIGHRELVQVLVPIAGRPPELASLDVKLRGGMGETLSRYNNRVQIHHVRYCHSQMAHVDACGLDTTSSTLVVSLVNPTVLTVTPFDLHHLG